MVELGQLEVQLLQVPGRLLVLPYAGWLMLRKLLAAAPAVVALVLALLAGAFGLLAAGFAESTEQYSFAAAESASSTAVRVILAVVPWPILPAS